MSSAETTRTQRYIELVDPVYLINVRANVLETGLNATSGLPMALAPASAAVTVSVSTTAPVDGSQSTNTARAFSTVAMRTRLVASSNADAVMPESSASGPV